MQTRAAEKKKQREKHRERTRREREQTPQETGHKDKSHTIPQETRRIRLARQLTQMTQMLFAMRLTNNQRRSLHPLGTNRSKDKHKPWSHIALIMRLLRMTNEFKTTWQSNDYSKDITRYGTNTKTNPIAEMRNKRKPAKPRNRHT